MGFPPLLNLSTRLSTAALPGQTTKMAQTLESMFQNVAYRPTVYRTGILPNLIFESQKLHISGQIQVTLCQNLWFLSYKLQILAPAMFFEPIKLNQNVKIG